MFGLLNLASAFSAAFFIDWAASPALPAADSGRMRATFICPVPSDWLGCAGPGGGALLPPLLKLNRSPAENPEHPASRPAAPPADAMRRPPLTAPPKPSARN